MRLCSWSKWEWFVIDLELRDMEDRMQTRHVVGKLEPIRLGTDSFDDLVRTEEDVFDFFLWTESGKVVVRVTGAKHNELAWSKGDITTMSVGIAGLVDRSFPPLGDRWPVQGDFSNVEMLHQKLGWVMGEVRHWE